MADSQARSPQEDIRLSVILITSDSYASIRKTVGYLQKQTIQSQIELVMVVPKQATLELVTDDLSAFASYQVVEVGAIQSIGRAYAVGIRAAIAPVVALAEDHCFPEPEWAEVLVSAHQLDDPDVTEHTYAAVGPALRNANPSTAISWADMLIAYAQWMHPAVGQTMNFLPGHNSSYKRAVLLSYGDRLEAMLESETLLHWDLRSKGYELYMEPRAIAAHTNFARLFPWLPVQFRAGMIFAGERAQVEGWSWGKRLAYFVASPLIPLVRLARILAALREGDRSQVKLATGTLPMTLLGLAADGLGQMVGYGFGYGNALQDYADAEFHRELHLAAIDLSSSQ